MLHIYTDGACKGNGKTNSRGGVGVFFGHNDERNIAEKLQGEPQTNQRAELSAILRALEVAPLDTPVIIVTDSSYSINCLTKWRKGFERNGWNTSKGEPVKNVDLIKGVIACIEARKARGTRTEFEWCKGHANHPGNVAADSLAVKGAQGW
ncbi:ribonuclease H-like domain-containing protein [Coniochaeta sp. 2T2.1]|nr:ribonuclease H-like domain-containing protein [Coniochaeta sp. 2T2.1]